MRERLGREAEASGRSLAQEVERRLEMSFEMMPLIEGMVSDRATLQLFQVTARVLRAVRKSAKKKGWTEIETRQALKQALEYIISVNFWTGEEVAGPPDGYPVHGKERGPTSPAQFGYDAAADVMIYGSVWEECDLQSDFGEVVLDRWSGDGTTPQDVEIASANANDPESLNDIVKRIEPSVQAMREDHERLKQDDTIINESRHKKQIR